MMKDLYDKLQESLSFIRQKTDFQAEIGLVLGSGLAGIYDKINIQLEIPYADIPNFPVSSVKGHSGKLLFGHYNDTPVVVMAGRFHYYEGYSMKEVTFPIRLLKFLGIEKLVITNASGGLIPGMKIGDIMLITDQIYMQTENPLRGPNDERLGPRFPDMSQPFDREMLQKADDIAADLGIELHHGVYVSVPGPNYETPAEYAFFHKIGGGAVGMSTGPEVIVARHMDMKVFGLSVIADIGYPPEEIVELTHDMVVDKVEQALPVIMRLLDKFIPQLKPAAVK